ncbi:MAG TPA: methyltransferase, partial [Flavisolibacter sp.]
MELIMANPYFQFKQFTIYHDRTAMKVTTDACLFGAWAAQEISQMPNIATMLDVGTGTGLLSMMVAQQKALETDAIEIDPDAAAQASENIKASPWATRIHVIQQDVNDLQPGRAYDVVISNPPFY